jgi:hypothetical protein
MSETRPYWLTEACPAWCQEQHRVADTVEDRRHVGGADAITLTLAEPEGSPVGPRRGDMEWTTPLAFVEIVQGWRESEPEIHVATSTDPFTLKLTAAEALALAGQIHQLLGVKP